MEDEVNDAIFNCDRNKALRLDGFNFNFFKAQLVSIKEEVMAFMKKFYDTSTFDERINSSIITLIPKCYNPMVLNEYKSISLVRSVYKVVTNVFANRFRVVIGEVVGLNQFTFIKGRQIVNCALIANELVDSLQKSRDGGVFFKVKEVDHFMYHFGCRFGSEAFSALVHKAVVIAGHYSPSSFCRAGLGNNGTEVELWKNVWDGLPPSKVKSKWPSENGSITDVVNASFLACESIMRKYFVGKTTSGMAQVQHRWGYQRVSWTSREQWVLAIREVVVIFAASSWASDTGIIIESDSKNAVAWITNPEASSWTLRQLILKIIALKNDLDKRFDSNVSLDNSCWGVGGPGLFMALPD
ncbi:Uncharacterized protein TCM_022263 [Theobroma cacao]|uniref:Reverse transcriptase domain-containing protein n=1 Tax=Theobroma cacao TaxID=3641 RepID=A0A061F094_THECC|nr:Uncharacterized protein TCM_022263 [Theobroma cacao]